MENRWEALKIGPLACCLTMSFAFVTCFQSVATAETTSYTVRGMDTHDDAMWEAEKNALDRARASCDVPSWAPTQTNITIIPHAYITSDDIQANGDDATKWDATASAEVDCEHRVVNCSCQNNMLPPSEENQDRRPGSIRRPQ